MPGMSVASPVAAFRPDFLGDIGVIVFRGRLFGNLAYVDA
jgi:hypothetical protein